MKSQIKQQLVEFATNIMDSKGSEEAEKLGLQHHGYGKYYTKDGKYAGKVVGDKFEPASDAAAAAPAKSGYSGKGEKGPVAKLAGPAADAPDPFDPYGDGTVNSPTSNVRPSAATPAVPAPDALKVGDMANYFTRDGQKATGQVTQIRPDGSIDIDRGKYSWPITIPAKDVTKQPPLPKTMPSTSKFDKHHNVTHAPMPSMKSMIPTGKPDLSDYEGGVTKDAKGNITHLQDPQNGDSLPLPMIRSQLDSMGKEAKKSGTGSLEAKAYAKAHQFYTNQILADNPEATEDDAEAVLGSNSNGNNNSLSRSASSNTTAAGTSDKSPMPSMKSMIPKSSEPFNANGEEESEYDKNPGLFGPDQ